MTATTAASPLQMLRAEIDVREFQRWMGVKRLQDPDHAMHCLLAECYGDLAPKPFRLIMPRSSGRGVLYGYGTASADELREAAAICADPLQYRILQAARLDSKPMPVHWRAGQRLGFEVRIRPVVRLLRDDSNRLDGAASLEFRSGGRRPGKECDAFQREAVQYPKGGMERKREEIYAEWLAEQMERIGGGALDTGSTRLVSFQRTRAYRKLRGRPSEGPDAIMRGVLTVAGSEAFAHLLARGVGRHRAYGYGMLLLRPARS